MKKLRVGVLASGCGSNLQAIIDACESGTVPSAEVAVVISNKEGAYALERARKHKIPAIFINPRDYEKKEDYERKVADVLQQHVVELVCLAGYMLLVGKVLLNSFPDRIMNIHPALLPSFVGMHAQRQALNYGVRFSGCTVHFVDSGMDTGPIILQEIVPVHTEDSEDDLSARILEKEHRIYPEAISYYAEGRLIIKGRVVHILTS